MDSLHLVEGWVGAEAGPVKVLETSAANAEAERDGGPRVQVLSVPWKEYPSNKEVGRGNHKRTVSGKNGAGYLSTNGRYVFSVVPLYIHTETINEKPLP